MFLARGIAICCSVFAIVYCSLSVLLSCGVWGAWSSVRRLAMQRECVRWTADVLFVLRIFPLVTAAAATIALAVPSFLLLEPRQIDEPLGWMPLTFGIFGAGLAVFGAANALVAIARASRTIAAWTRAAQPVAEAPVPVLRIVPAVPAMTATGILRPRILLSAAAESLLTQAELRAALNHEMAHVQRRDNLRKVILRLVAFPGMHGLERAWLESVEMAADDAAVCSAEDALELATALIKLSRSGPIPPALELTAALVQSPASFMNARVERLLAWGEKREPQRPRRSLAWYEVGGAMAGIALFAAGYSPILVGIHAATEWLVR